MTSDIIKSPAKVLIDTNVLISALGFGGKPRQVLLFTLQRRIKLVTSSILQAELHEVVNKKFPLLAPQLSLFERKIKKHLLVVNPKKSINIVSDVDDNRVLEAAVEGKCAYIITGDTDLLDLESYKWITILTPAEFLELTQKS